MKNNWKRHTNDRGKKTEGGAGDNEGVLSVPPTKWKKHVSDLLDISNLLSMKRSNDDDCAEVIFLSSLLPDM
jgi:hypothetical protein